MNVDVTVTRAHIKRLKAVSKIEKEREREDGRRSKLKETLKKRAADHNSKDYLFLNKGLLIL